MQKNYSEGEQKMDEELIREYVGNVKWQFASSMKNIPHFYTLKKWSYDEDVFFKFVDHIWKNGVEGKFYSKTYKYFYFDGWKYWTMDKTVLETDLINRERVV